MSLSELVSNLTPATYSQLALLLFVGVFLAIAWRFRRANTELADTAGLPLADDDAPHAPREANHE